MNIIFSTPQKSRLVRFQRLIKSLPGLSVYYPLNENSGLTAFNRALSSVGTLNGTNSNVTVGQAGKSGNAYSFDGNGDRVIITGFSPAATFSFSFLFKRNGSPDANDRIMDQASGGPTRGWHMNLDTNGNLGLRTWNDGGAQLTLDYGILADNVWYLVGGTVGASSTKLYLNGEPIVSGSGNSFGAGVIADLQFGARSGGTNNAMSGSMQHVAIGSGASWTDAQHKNIARSIGFGQSRVLTVGGESYKMRAWEYSSNYLGGSSSNGFFVQPNQIPYDMTDIVAAGMNTVKVYADENNQASHLAALDQIAAAGLKAIVLRFITYSTDYSEATGGANRVAAIANYTGMITKLKNHPAIIGWGFANENNYNLGSTSKHDFYTMLEAAMQAGKAIDSTRFHYTTNGELADIRDYGNTLAPSIDVWGANIYRGTAMTNIIRDIVCATSKPVLITEWGRSREGDDGGSAQTTQATEVLALLQEVESYYPFIAGHSHFKFTDTVSPGEFGVTAALSQGTYEARTKFTAYNSVKDYMSVTPYGGS